MAEEKMFPVVFRGYDVTAVNASLEAKDGEIRRLQEELEEAKQKIELLQEEMAQKDVISKDLGDMFLVAQTAADHYRADTQAKMDAQMEQARQKAEKLVKSAEEKRASILAQTQEEARIIREHVMRKKTAVDLIVASVLSKMKQGCEELESLANNHTMEHTKTEKKEE